MIGTSTNILVSSIAEEKGQPAFSMFEIAPLGLIMFAVGMVYMLTVGIRLIPDRRAEGDLIESFDLAGIYRRSRFARKRAVGRTRH